MRLRPPERARTDNTQQAHTMRRTTCNEHASGMSALALSGRHRGALRRRVRRGLERLTARICDLHCAPWLVSAACAAFEGTNDQVEASNGRNRINRS